MHLNSVVTTRDAGVYSSSVQNTPTFLFSFLNGHHLPYPYSFCSGIHRDDLVS
eukprot:c29382_g3_i1 orf=3-158(-)